mmetsp:Transcript_33313/g.94791  ORF Transcript_33313/g.94791 Transcript_33313/m.94791 type:complete len:349 (-) Transcript_33313:34-1080(-)
MEIRQLFRFLSGLVLLSSATNAFSPNRHKSTLSISTTTSSLSHLYSTSPTTPSAGAELTRKPDRKPSVDWELDCYSRPVVAVGGKKLWEVLITDSTGSFRYIKTLPSNQVNSKELRATVEELVEKIDLKPNTIRYFRGAMFNMIKIALSELDLVGRASRCTYAVAQWLEERHRDVYPKMEGYRPNMATTLGGPSFLDVRTPVKMPDALRGEKYAFVSLPLAEFLEGGGVTDENIGVGKLCPVPDNLPADGFVQGIIFFTQRPEALAAWLAGTEVAGMTCDLRKRNLIMETDIDTQYLVARLNDIQREEGAAFEEGKEQMGGLHFLGVQKGEDDDPAGFWLMRELPTGI